MVTYGLLRRGNEPRRRQRTFPSDGNGLRPAPYSLLTKSRGTKSLVDDDVVERVEGARNEAAGEAAGKSGRSRDEKRGDDLSPSCKTVAMAANLS